MTRKFALAALALVLVTGLCLAAPSLNASSDIQAQARIKKAPVQAKGIYVPPVKRDPKVWHINESFEGSFPPAGWVVHDVQDPTHTWTQYNYYAHTGTYSAGLYWAPSGVTGEDLLVTPQITVQSNDTCYFWFLSWNTGWTPDDTYLVLSTTDNQAASFTVELLHIPESSYSNSWVLYAVDLSAYAGQQVYLAFKNINSDGDGVDIDDVLIGHEYTPTPGDLALQSIDEPSAAFIEPGLPFTPAATVENPGTTPMTDFQVIYSIDDGVTKALVYQDTVLIASPDSLFPDSVRQVTFDDFTPLDLTNYYVTAYVVATGDPNQANDTLTTYFRTFNELVGNVSDDNNGGAPLAGVAIEAAGPATYTTTTDGDGNYFFFDMTAGTYDVTAELAGYIDEEVTGVTITDFAQTTLDLSMGYPVLALSPTDSVYVSLPWGGADSTTWQFTVENTGTRDMSYNVYWPESTLTKGAKAPVTLVLDDGSRDNDIGIGGVSEMIWVNRFTPAGGEYPFMLNQVQFYFSALGNVAVGHGIVIVVYENTTGGNDPAVGSNLLYQYATTVQAVDAWNVYDLPEPVLLNGPGDVVIGAINTFLPGSSYWPASLDQTATQQRSWAGAWSTATHPEPPTLPPDDLWTLIDAYFPGNWMVRGYGETGGGNAVWLNITPASGTVSAYGTENLTVKFDAAGLDSFTDWAANVRFHTNAAADQFVPAWMHVLGLTGVSGGPTQPLSYAFGLNANRPNPVNGRTTFSFTLPKAQDYALRVYNVSGQLVQSFSGRGQAGPNSVAWNTGRNGAGVYFYQLASGGLSATRKLVVLK